MRRRLQQRCVPTCSSCAIVYAPVCLCRGVAIALAINESFSRQSLQGASNHCDHALDLSLLISAVVVYVHAPICVPIVLIEGRTVMAMRMTLPRVAKRKMRSLSRRVARKAALEARSGL